MWYFLYDSLAIIRVWKWKRKSKKSNCAKWLMVPCFFYLQMIKPSSFGMYDMTIKNHLLHAKFVKCFLLLIDQLTMQHVALLWKHFYFLFSHMLPMCLPMEICYGFKMNFFFFFYCLDIYYKDLDFKNSQVVFNA